MSPFYNNALLEIAIDAQQLSRGESEEVLKRKTLSIPSLAQAYYGHYYKFMPNNNSRYESLWQVQKYYEISGDVTPEQIKPILDSLPPRPLTSCEIQKNREQK